MQTKKVKARKLTAQWTVETLHENAFAVDDDVVEKITIDIQRQIDYKTTKELRKEYWDKIDFVQERLRGKCEWCGGRLPEHEWYCDEN